jgi:hypothetical protein
MLLLSVSGRNMTGGLVPPSYIRELVSFEVRRHHRYQWWLLLLSSLCGSLDKE